MYSILVLVVMINLSLSEGFSKRYPSDYWSSQRDAPYHGDEVVNIGNGSNKKNNVVIEDLPDPSDAGAPRVTNIGNGYHNYNKVVIGGTNTDVDPQRSDYDGWKNGGTTVTRDNNKEIDIVNVGYGHNNKNKVTVDGKPIPLDCFGSHCGNIRRVSSGTGTHQAFTIFLTFTSFFYFILV